MNRIKYVCYPNNRNFYYKKHIVFIKLMIYSKNVAMNEGENISDNNKQQQNPIIFINSIN